MTMRLQDRVRLLESQVQFLLTKVERLEAQTGGPSPEDDSRLPAHKTTEFVNLLDELSKFWPYHEGSPKWLGAKEVADLARRLGFGRWIPSKLGVLLSRVEGQTFNAKILHKGKNRGSNLATYRFV